jgi:hypothetical protein
MPDLKGGESVEMPGSAGRPYVLKNVGEVYSSSCPTWRHQSLAIERRTCKHLQAPALLTQEGTERQRPSRRERSYGH